MNRKQWSYYGVRFDLFSESTFLVVQPLYLSYFYINKKAIESCKWFYEYFFVFVYIYIYQSIQYYSDFFSGKCCHYVSQDVPVLLINMEKFDSLSFIHINFHIVLSFLLSPISFFIDPIILCTQRVQVQVCFLNLENFYETFPFLLDTFKECLNFTPPVRIIQVNQSLRLLTLKTACGLIYKLGPLPNLTYTINDSSWSQ